jgi:hypothetical protein
MCQYTTSLAPLPAGRVALAFAPLDAPGSLPTRPNDRVFLLDRAVFGQGLGNQPSSLLTDRALLVREASIRVTVRAGARRLEQPPQDRVAAEGRGIEGDVGHDQCAGCRSFTPAWAR